MPIRHVMPIRYVRRRPSAWACTAWLAGALALLPTPSSADVRPLVERLAAGGAQAYAGLGRAEHVYGYAFRTTGPGTLEALSGRFAGTKRVYLVDDADAVLASADVAATPAAFVETALASPVSLTPGARYRVLVRAGTAGSTSAVWSLALPFAEGDVEITESVQGWSPSADPGTWIGSVSPLAGNLARGLVDVRFAPAGGPGGPTLPPVAGDPYPATPGTIDSFGDAAPTGELGAGFAAVAAYHAEFPRRAGECSREVHDRYWTRDARGITHPSWHPVRDPATGCAFAHEHGDDPRRSANYDFAGGTPFGLTHGGHGGEHGGEHGGGHGGGSGSGHRHEDHVGHKVVVQNGYGLVAGSPQNGSGNTTDAIVRTGVTCDWLSKIHQGSSTRDALGNNAHEYHLNVRCTDGVRLRLKQLVTFGPPELVTSICRNPPLANAEDALAAPSRTSQRFPTGVPGTQGVPVTAALDGKREFACIDDLARPGADRLEELWKADGVVGLPGGGYVNYSPYYAVLNPARYMDHRWSERGAPDAYVASLDLCFDDNAAWRGRAPGWCSGVPAALAERGSAERQRDPSSPMNGTRRVVHPKELVVSASNEPGTGPDLRFCTDRLGRAARAPDEGEACGATEMEQLVSRTTRKRWDWKGSDVNATLRGGTLHGAGYLNEWVRNFDDASIRFPN